MCGIIGYIGDDNALRKIEYGLKKLEYRGYDSAGVAFFKTEKNCSKQIDDICKKDKKFAKNSKKTAKNIKNYIKIEKNLGTVEKLFEKIDVRKIANVAIGHTRWATHGKVCIENCHPHKSQYGRVVLVHNGIIENYLDIKSKCLKDKKFSSNTDSEVVANLIEYFLNNGDNKLDAILKTIKMLKGSFALAILFDDDSKIYFAKRISPLLLGFSKNGTYISSDVLGFDIDAKHYIDLPDDSFGYITKTNYKIFDANKNEILLKTIVMQSSKKNDDKNRFPFYMIKEIHEIPAVLKNTVSHYASKNTLLSKLNFQELKKINRIRFVACGTSYHASLVGEKLLKRYGFDATSEIASEFIYSPSFVNQNTLCVFLSQSGETADTLKAISIAKKFGAKTLGVTNVLTSSIVKMCDYVLPIFCGNEIAVASTKAFNAEVCCLIVFAEYFKTIAEKSKEIKHKKIKNAKNFDFFVKNIEKIAKKIKKIANFIDINDFEKQVKPFVQSVLKAKNVMFVGKDFDFVAALESSLKLKEISYINSIAYASGELKHGTISLVDENSLTFAFVTEKQLIDKTMNVVNQIKSRGGNVVIITQFENLVNNAESKNIIKLPNIDEIFIPLISIIPIQLLSYHVSVALGYDPDKPRNLAKSVTVE